MVQRKEEHKYGYGEQTLENGKGVYKCRFGHRVVKAFFEQEEQQPTITCKSPPFVRTKSREKAVKFSIIIFSHSKDTVDHVVSHSRKFVYYTNDELMPTIQSASPLSGPTSGGTAVVFEGKIYSVVRSTTADLVLNLCLHSFLKVCRRLEE